MLLRELSKRIKSQCNHVRVFDLRKGEATLELVADETTEAHGEHTMNADEHSGYSQEDFYDASWGRVVHLNNNL